MGTGKVRSAGEAGKVRLAGEGRKDPAGEDIVLFTLRYLLRATTKVTVDSRKKLHAFTVSLSQKRTC